MRGRGKGEGGRVTSEATTRLLVQVQPRAPLTEIVGWHGDAIKIRVAAPPVDDAANAELIRFLAARLEIPRAEVRIASGATARRKRVEITGLDPAAVLGRLGVR